MKNVLKGLDLTSGGLLIVAAASLIMWLDIDLGAVVGWVNAQLEELAVTVGALVAAIGVWRAKAKDIAGKSGG